MSSSDLAERGSGSIAATAPAGVEIKILDAHLGEVATGFEEVEKELSPGIYTVRWIAGDQSEQQVLRLRPGDEHELDPKTLIAGAAHSGDADLTHRQFRALADALRKPMIGKTELALFICANDANTTSGVGSSVEVRALDQKSGRWKRRVPVASERSSEQDGWVFRRYEVEPGPHVLRYTSPSRTVVEQSFHALARRRSLAWLRYSRESRPEWRKEEATLVSRRGIDPASSRFLSFDDAVADEALNAANLLADVLTWNLAHRTGTLDADLVRRVGSCTDPYLILYAAGVLLTRPLNPTELWPDAEPHEAMSVPQQNLAAAKHLLAALFRDRHFRGWPDLLCARWRIALGERDPEPPDAAQPLESPPMLECAWRWASAWSVHHPVIDPAATPSLRGVSNGQERSTPWLAWRAADEYRTFEVLESRSVETDARSTAEAAAQLSELFDSAAKIGLTSILTPQTLDLANAVLRIGGTEHWQRAGQALINRLAGAAGLPIAALMPVLETALSELRNAERKAEGGAADLLNSDPNRGQFGGTAECSGLVLKLDEIMSSNSKDFLGLTLAAFCLDRERPLKGTVRFHLHPTFSPALVPVAVIDGEARHTCYAWGAFTVGVETQDGRRAELDLSAEKRLPAWFRNR